jgi:hypothetical protein
MEQQVPIEQVQESIIERLTKDWQDIVDQHRATNRKLEEALATANKTNAELKTLTSAARVEIDRLRAKAEGLERERNLLQVGVSAAAHCFAENARRDARGPDIVYSATPDPRFYRNRGDHSVVVEIQDRDHQVYFRNARGWIELLPRGVFDLLFEPAPEKAKDPRRLYVQCHEEGDPDAFVSGSPLPILREFEDWLRANGHLKE